MISVKNSKRAFEVAIGVYKYKKQTYRSLPSYIKTLKDFKGSQNGFCVFFYQNIRGIFVWKGSNPIFATNSLFRRVKANFWAKVDMEVQSSFKLFFQFIRHQIYITLYKIIFMQKIHCLFMDGMDQDFHSKAYIWFSCSNFKILRCTALSLSFLYIFMFFINARSGFYLW